MRKQVTIVGLGGMLACANVAQAKTHYSLFNCDHVLTVQTNACTVEKHFKCPSQTAYSSGISVFGDEGIVFQALMNSEGFTVYENDFFNKIKLRMIPQLSDDISDTSWRSGAPYKMETVYGSTENMPTMRTNTYNGQLSSEMAIIDGVSLTKGAYHLDQQYSFENTGMKSTVTALGEYFYAKDLDIFFGGHSKTKSDELDENGKPYPERYSDETPVDFIYPDEENFKSQAPKYGCQSIS
jgi:hypothetical protein